MKHCTRCGKVLRKGSEVHRVDDELFCSKECAVSQLEEVITLSARDAALEQYDEDVEIIHWSGPQMVDSSSTDKCCVCDTDLATCGSIIAAEGHLYCSRECAIHDFENAYGSVAERHLDNVAEEITPEDIGIEPAYKAPSSKGMSREAILAAIENLAQSQGFYGRLLEVIRGASEEVRDEFLSTLEQQNFSDTVDLVMYLEG